MDWTMHVCDVHRLVDKDETPRECKFCGRCRAWICKECRNDWAKRGKAMLLAQKEKVENLVQGPPTGNPYA